MGSCPNPISMIGEKHSIVIDSYSYYGNLIISFFYITFLIISTNHKNQSLNFEFWVLLMLSTLALCFLIKAYNLVMIYKTIKFSSSIFYILASLKWISEYSGKSELKYFVFVSFSSALFPFGFVLLYSLTEKTNLLDFSIFCSGFYTNNRKLNFFFKQTLVYFLSHRHYFLN